MSTQPNQAPLGWNFNPSARSHRLRILPFATAALAIALYLALCQMNVIQCAWNPVFKDGTSQVLHSSLSRALPFPDALAGAIAYGFEIGLLVIGDSHRWLTRPWLALLSGLTAFGLGAASLVLLFLQPAVVHAGCLECMVIAALALMIAQRSACEFLASVQTGILVCRLGQDPVRWFFHGSDEETSKRLTTSPERASDFPWTEGTQCVWTLFSSVILGALTLAVPSVFGIEGIGKYTIELCGIGCLGVSLISMCDPLRFMRWLNGGLGALLFCWFLGAPTGADRWTCAGIGLALIGLCFYPGKSRRSYGLFSSPTEILRRLGRKRPELRELSEARP